MLDPFQDEKPEDVDRLRELHDDIFRNFKDHIRQRRGDRLLATDDALFTGDIWTGREAVEVGLIDGLAEMRSEMRKRHGDGVKFLRTEIRRGLLSRFRGEPDLMDESEHTREQDEPAQPLPRRRTIRARPGRVDFRARRMGAVETIRAVRVRI